MEKPAIEVMAQGAPNVGGVSPTYNILFPHKTIKQQWKKKKSTPVDICSSYMIVRILYHTQDCIIPPLENDYDIKLLHLT